MHSELTEGVEENHEPHTRPRGLLFVCGGRAPRRKGPNLLIPGTRAPAQGLQVQPTAAFSWRKPGRGSVTLPDRESASPRTDTWFGAEFYRVVGRVISRCEPVGDGGHFTVPGDAGPSRRSRKLEWRDWSLLRRHRRESATRDPNPRSGPPGAGEVDPNMTPGADPACL
jgi:hypothetical protein